MMCALVTTRGRKYLWRTPFPHKLGHGQKVLCISTMEEIDRLQELLSVPRKLTKVYLMHDRRTDLYKIGSSKHPIYRERTLQSDNPLVDLFGYWNSEVKMEGQLHKRFASKRVRGEWFRLTAGDFTTVMEIMRPYQFYWGTSAKAFGEDYLGNYILDSRK